MGGITGNIPAFTRNGFEAWVSADEGSDIYGRIHAQERPFATIQAAITALEAVTDDTVDRAYTIYILPGDYDEQALLAGGGGTSRDATFIYSDGANHIYTGLDSKAVVTRDGVSGVSNINIWGWGHIQRTGVGGAVFEAAGATYHVHSAKFIGSTVGDVHRGGTGIAITENVGSIKSLAGICFVGQFQDVRNCPDIEATAAQAVKTNNENLTFTDCNIRGLWGSAESGVTTGYPTFIRCTVTGTATQAVSHGSRIDAEDSVFINEFDTAGLGGAAIRLFGGGTFALNFKGVNELHCVNADPSTHGIDAFLNNVITRSKGMYSTNDFDSRVQLQRFHTVTGATPGDVFTLHIPGEVVTISYLVVGGDTNSDVIDGLIAAWLLEIGNNNEWSRYFDDDAVIAAAQLLNSPSGTLEATAVNQFTEQGGLAATSYASVVGAGLITATFTIARGLEFIIPTTNVIVDRNV